MRSTTDNNNLAPSKWYYFILAAPVYLLMWLPFPVLYFLSDLLSILARDVLGYRKKVIYTNLRNSFPDKSEAEIAQIAHTYYRNMIDLFIETFKALTMSKATMMKRCRFNNFDMIINLFNQKKSIILMLGHYGNWEWGGFSYTYHSPEQTNTLYHPLSNAFFEWLTYRIRQRCGVHLIPMQTTLRRMMSYRDRLTLTAFIADQSPTPEGAHWLTFLHQDTGFFTGGEKIAQKFNYPVVYARITRYKRGYYQVDFEMISSEPATEKENVITEKFARLLEADIRNKPDQWLWSHKRWKHKRLSDNAI